MFYLNFSAHLDRKTGFWSRTRWPKRTSNGVREALKDIVSRMPMPFSKLDIHFSIHRKSLFEFSIGRRDGRCLRISID